LDFLEIYKHILPRAEAWLLTPAKRLRELFEGLSFETVKTYLDLIWLDIFPSTTRCIDDWEDAFGLPDYGLNEQERRDRLDARWKEEGAQDPRYIEDTLRNAGFDVYVHEWWIPGTEPAVNVEGCAEPRNPVELLKSDIILDIECGTSFAECGNEQAECGATLNPLGYILVNKDSTFTTKPIIEAGEAAGECGNTTAECGFTIVETTEDEHLTLDTRKWPFFLYIGGETFPDLAQVPVERRAEFEELILRIRPLQQWLGMLIEYV
jgi:hypothetical protein